MQKQTLNYRIFIEKEKAPGRKKGYVYNALCPSLGLADFGASLDEAVKNITDLIAFHIESLAFLGHPIPAEGEATTVVTSVSIPFSAKRKLIFT